MCGILGVASTEPINDRSWLSACRDTMIHRGPDAAGELWIDEGRIGMGHRRLSIIDLSNAGDQPMYDKNQGLSIVFNGEIYNFSLLRTELEGLGHNFKSQSDTEILLKSYAQWGKKCVDHFNGMFAFAIYDSKKQILFLARDRAGEKPLFYKYVKGLIYFSSELKAMMKHEGFSRRIDREALDCYLAMGYIPGDRCIFKGYNKLPPAHALEFHIKTGDLQIWRYWSLPEFSSEIELGKTNEKELLDELEVLFESSVSQQMVADVPVGILLSGGVDSSLVTAMAVRSTNKIKTFNIRFPGYGKLDETKHARLIANYFGTEHIELEGQPAIADLVPQLAYQFDEPMADSSMIPTYLVSQLVREKCTVALGGDGGDELFGGYNHYSNLLWMQRRLGRIPFPLLRIISKIATSLVPIGMKGRNYFQALEVDLNTSLPLIATFFDIETRKKLMSGQGEWSLLAEGILNKQIPLIKDIVQRATRIDFQNYLSEDLLVKVDRSSMLSSLEMRAPLLDYRLIEFAFAKVPSHYKSTINNRKILLKRLAARLLPSEFDFQRKQGFSIPLSQWLKQGVFRQLFWDVLLDKECLFDRNMVKKLLLGQDRGHNNNERLYALVFFELWRREYNVSI